VGAAQLGAGCCYDVGAGRQGIDVPGEGECHLLSVCEGDQQASSVSKLLSRG
jgi:hypothetical protein